MTSTLKKLLAFTTLAASAALAKPCVGFDSYFNLYVFGGATDYALGPQDAWFNSSELSPFAFRAPVQATTAWWRRHRRCA